jgi:hypothetical protein
MQKHRRQRLGRMLTYLTRLEALDLVQSLSSERALISESRITTIIDTARSAVASLT